VNSLIAAVFGDEAVFVDDSDTSGDDFSGFEQAE